MYTVLFSISPKVTFSIEENGNTLSREDHQECTDISDIDFEAEAMQYGFSMHFHKKLIAELKLKRSLNCSMTRYLWVNS